MDDHARTCIGTSADAYAWARWSLDGLAWHAHEYLILGVLDARREAVASRVWTNHDSRTVAVTAESLLRFAMRHDGEALLIAHTHVATTPVPSDADVAFTRELQRAANVLGLDLVDHLILVHAANAPAAFDAELFFSFADNGLLDPGL